MSKNNFGIGVITCDRPEFVTRLLNSLNSVCENIFVINDGATDLQPDNTDVYYLNTEAPRSGVGNAKNVALKQLMQEKSCEYFFLLEDDVFINDVSVFEKYIEASVISGIQHFNFAFHGVDNYNPDKTPAIKLRVEYTPEHAICLYPNVYGAFSFYTRRCIEECGYMDEHYYNALEHVAHTYDIIKKQMHPPFRWFADIADSWKYITEQDYNHTGSTIRKDQTWVQNFHKMADYFAQQNKFDVRDSYAPTASKEEVVDIIRKIKKIYGSK